ncbi:hypothetical protein PENTCL1PPCAC_27736, partial [Pristionchus entomophagus]
ETPMLYHRINGAPRAQYTLVAGRVADGNVHCCMSAPRPAPIANVYTIASTCRVCSTLFTYSSTLSHSTSTTSIACRGQSLCFGCWFSGASPSTSTTTNCTESSVRPGSRPCTPRDLCNTLLGVYPVSSFISRIAACSTLSFASIIPAGNSRHHARIGIRYCLIRMKYFFPSLFRMATISTPSTSIPGCFTGRCEDCHTPSFPSCARKLICLVRSHRPSKTVVSPHRVYGHLLSLIIASRGEDAAAMLRVLQ